MRRHPGMTHCSVEEHCSAWLVAFYTGSRKTTLLLQSDYDQAAFAAACGKIKAGRDWDGRPSTLPDPEEFYGLDVSSIEYCPLEYKDMAE